MFAIASPQTVTLTIPGDDAPSTLINFRTNGADTSRCVMEIVTPEGDIHRLTFNVRGAMLDSQFTPKGEDASEQKPLVNAADYMVGGRDIRADNPYTHVAPVDADSAYRPADVGFRATPSAEEAGKQREAREQAMKDAAGKAKEARQAEIDKLNETSEQRAERLRKEQDERLHNAVDSLEPGTDGYVRREETQSGSSAPLRDEYAKGTVFPNEQTQRMETGKNMDGSPQADPDANLPYPNAPRTPMAPAPSSPLPGSPPPHPLGQSDPGKVTTSKEIA